MAKQGEEAEARTVLDDGPAADEDDDDDAEAATATGIFLPFGADDAMGREATAAPSVAERTSCEESDEEGRRGQGSDEARRRRLGLLLLWRRRVCLSRPFPCGRWLGLGPRESRTMASKA
jgi:hypothetical protein